MLGNPLPDTTLSLLEMTLGRVDCCGNMGKLVDVKTIESSGDMLLIVLISCDMATLYIGLPDESLVDSNTVFPGFPYMFNL